MLTPEFSALFVFVVSFVQALPYLLGFYFFILEVCKSSNFETGNMNKRYLTL